MAGSINKVIIIGNLGSDPEIRNWPNGGCVANLSIATSEQWKDKTSGEKKEKTEWHRVVVKQNGDTGVVTGFIEPYLRKGAKVYIEGKIETRKWEKDGIDRYSTEIIVSGFGGQIVSLSKGENGGGNRSESRQDSQNKISETKSQGWGDKPATDLSDDIPF